MEYKAEDFISFIENNRQDKVSPNGLELIAKRFRELECEVNKLSLATVSGSLHDELDLIDDDLADFYRKQDGNYFTGTPLLAQLTRELKKLNFKSNDH